MSRLYRRLIVEATGCTDDDARGVEWLMRVDSGTLDHLTRARLFAAARRAYKALPAFRARHPTWRPD